MSNFREAQNQAHPNKTNTLMVGILFLLIGILAIQIWLLYSALNNALAENHDIAIASFAGSTVLFVMAIWLLRYIPQAREASEKKSPSKYK